jgi:hypothetical protein
MPHRSKEELGKKLRRSCCKTETDGEASLFDNTHEAETLGNEDVRMWTELSCLRTGSSGTLSWKG